MRALVYRPGLPAELLDVRDFKHIQELCGGHIERVILDWGGKRGNRWIQLWCNEDGISQRLPLNLWAEGPSYAGTPIFGTAVLLAGRRTEDDEDDLALTDEEVARWASAFKRAPAGPLRGALSRCASCLRDFPPSRDGDRCVACGSGPICTECWVVSGERCGDACATAAANEAERAQAERLSAKKNGDDLP